MKQMLVLALVALVAAGVLTGCGSRGKTDAFTIVMGQNGAMSYTPNSLAVGKGDTVKITLVNKDPAQSHSFVINELNVKSEQVPANTTKILTFKASKAGTFEFYCDVPGHKDMGMKGTITVTG